MKIRLTVDDALLDQAAFYTGLYETSALASEALKALIERESARRLAALGATEPDAAIAPRRRASVESR
jgi:hypothetical protein